MNKYEIIIYWSEEDSLFNCEIPELSGCTAHGEIQEKALKNIKDTMQLWMDTAKEFGNMIPEPKRWRQMYAWQSVAPERFSTLFSYAQLCSKAAGVLYVKCAEEEG